MSYPKLQITQILNSGNHAERLLGAATRRKEVQLAREKLLSGKGITEEELRAAGYERDVRSDDPERESTELYLVCHSTSGRELKTFMFRAGHIFEEERMVDIAETIAFSLHVDVNRIGLVKPPESIKDGLDCSECRILVIVNGRDCRSSRSRSRSGRSIR